MYMKFLREPLVHFLFVGAILFILFRTVGNRETDEVREIRITPAKIDNLIEIWGKTWQRPPTPEELNSLIEEHIKEEILYREALALGLDQNDTIIRRRLRQKMEFIVEDVATVAEPTDQELQAYLDDHAESYRLDSLVTFQHVYLNADRRGGTLDKDTALILAELAESGEKVDIPQIGDPISLPGSFSMTPEREVAKLFGRKFSDSLMKLDTEKWVGPVGSGYGIHLVYVTDRTFGSVPEVNEIREALRRDWTAARRRDANDEFYEMLRRRYEVSIEFPGPAGAISERVAQVE